MPSMKIIHRGSMLWILLIALLKEKPNSTGLKQGGGCDYGPGQLIASGCP